MDEIQSVTEVAKVVSDLGIVIVLASAFLILSVLMWVAIFKWFKSIINQVLNENKKGLQDLLEEEKNQNSMLYDLSEGLRSETQLRIRNLSGFAFDLSIEQVCRLIKNVREENHIADREATAKKVRGLLQNIHDDRLRRFDPFTYRGKCISEFCDQVWVEKVAKIVENELYNPIGADNKRAHTNVKMVYDEIQLEFYRKLSE